MDEHDIVDWATSALPWCALLWAGWLCLPEFLKLTRICGFRNGILAGPEGVATEKMPPQLVPLAQQLPDLGFRPLGVYWESDDIRRHFTEFLFTSREHGCYAALYSLFGDDARVSLVTLFTDGAQVHTKNFTDGVEAESEELSAWGLATHDLSQVLEQHRETVGGFVATRHTPSGRLDLEEYQDAQRNYYAYSNTYAKLRNDWIASLVGKLVILGLGFAVPFLILDGDDVAPAYPWLGLLAGCAACVAIGRAIVRALTYVGTADERCPFGDEPPERED